MLYVVGFVALAVVPVLALNSLATANPGAGSATEGSPPRGAHGITDAQRQCLTEHGATLPARAADGARPALTPDQRNALRTAAQACGLPFRGRGVHWGRRAALRQCLTDQGVTLPARAADGARPALTQDERDALRRAAVACGLPLGRHPSRGLGGRASV
jgi:hypothetical protein